MSGCTYGCEAACGMIEVSAFDMGEVTITAVIVVNEEI